MEKNSHENANNQKDAGIGPIVGTFIIVIVLIAAVVYVWSEHLNTVAQIQQEERQSSSITTITTYSTSTAPADIQNDLKATPMIKNPGF